MNRVVFMYKVWAVIGQIQKGEPAMKWLPSVISILSLIIPAIAPVVQHSISLHPLVAMIYTAALGIAAHFSPPPAGPESK